MRALCGAIITAGALVALGLTALSYGIRYQDFGPDVINRNTDQIYAAPTLAIIFVTALVGAFVGLGITFLGLAYHHERRLRERLGELGSGEHTVTSP